MGLQSKVLDAASRTAEGGNMKIICTEDEKEWLFPLLLNSDRCPKTMDCNGRTCEQCLNEGIEWVIEPPKEEI